VPEVAPTQRHARQKQSLRSRTRATAPRVKRAVVRAFSFQNRPTANRTGRNPARINSFVATSANRACSPASCFVSETRTTSARQQARTTATKARNHPQPPILGLDWAIAHLSQHRTSAAHSRNIPPVSANDVVVGGGRGRCSPGSLNRGTGDKGVKATTRKIAARPNDRDPNPRNNRQPDQQDRHDTIVKEIVELRIAARAFPKPC